MMEPRRCDACGALVHDGVRYAVSGAILSGWAEVARSNTHPVGLARVILACPACPGHVPRDTESAAWGAHAAAVKRRVRDRIDGNKEGR